MFYLINKPTNISSFKAIKDFARENNIKKIGHTGTLDPLASGLLLVATDEDTKLIEYIDQGHKTYQATMELGKTSDTYDSQGQINTLETPKIDPKQVILAIKSFTGEQMQTPPVFSAKKVQGQRAYNLARQGIKTELKPVKINIISITNIKAINSLTYQFDVCVSRGTYIRSLIHDIGQKLLTGAIMTKLIRTKIGDLNLVDKPTIVDIKNLLNLKIMSLQDIKNLIHGKEQSTNYSDGKYALEYKGQIIGIGNVKNKVLKSQKLLGNKIARLY